jgi:hypothetical protein
MLVLAAEAQQAPPVVARSLRIDALDWTKGALIICMVVYHAINYSAFRAMAFRFLGFLPPSFILISGFLVGQVYAGKYDLGTWKPYARLAIRGMKVIAIFTALNVIHCVALERNLYDGLLEFTGRAGGIFLSGNGRGAVFEILLPIGYFLLLAPVLLWLRSRYSGAVAICALALFLLCFGLERAGQSSKNLDLFSAGLVGMTIGLIPMEKIDRFARKWIPVLLLYVLYRLCTYSFGETYSVQMLGATITLLLLYCFALRLGATAWSSRQMVTLGKYSLFGYLAQIAALQAVVRVSGGRPGHWIGVFAVAAVTTVLLFFIVLAIHKLRQRSRFIDVTYGTVFA